MDTIFQAGSVLIAVAAKVYGKDVSLGTFRKEKGHEYNDKTGTIGKK